MRYLELIFKYNFYEKQIQNLTASKSNQQETISAKCLSTEHVRAMVVAAADIKADAAVCQEGAKNRSKRRIILAGVYSRLSILKRRLCWS